MESFEQQAIATSGLKPKIWLRYVDDTFILWPHGEPALERFHNHINQQHPLIQFTRETESDNKIPFLDVLVKRDEGRVSTTVYRKPTHTNRYLNFRSNHHPRILTGVLKCLKNRADRVCDERHQTEELKHLRDTFRANGYPMRLIKYTLQKSPKDPNSATLEAPEGNPKLLSLPYIRGLSEEIQRRYKHLDVRTVFKSSSTLRNSLVRVKSPTPGLKKKGVVAIRDSMQGL